MSYFERCQDWLAQGEGRTEEALKSALQGIQKKLSSLDDAATDEYQDLECTQELLQDQLQLLPTPVQSQPLDATNSSAASKPIEEPSVDLDTSSLHPLEVDEIQLNVEQKREAIDSMLQNPLLARGMPRKS